MADKSQKPLRLAKQKITYERYLELENLIPTQGTVTSKYWEKQENIRPKNYQYLTLIKKSEISQMS